MFETTLFYIVLTLFLVFLCDISKKKKNDKGVILAYIIMAVVSIIRYDVGWDYLGYTRNVENICNIGFTNVASIIIATSGKISEPFFVGLCYLFQDMTTPYLWVFGSYSLLTILFIFLAVNNHKYKNLDPDRNKWAIIAVVIYYYLFFIWDVQRQGLAIAMVLFSYKYIRDRKLLKYLIVIILSCCVHLSAFLALPLYWLTSFRFNKGLSLFLFVFVLFLYAVGVFQSLQSLAEHVPYFSSYASDKRYMDSFYGFSILMLFKYIMWGLTIFLIPSKQDFVGNAFTIGVIIYIMSSGAQVFERFGDYYYFSIILLFPEIIKNSNKHKALLAATIIVTSFVCFYDMAITQKRGVMPYKTIMSDDYQKGHFKEREVD